MARWAAEQRLQANDPDMVMSMLTEAFDDNEAPAAPLGVDGGEVSLAVLVPTDSAIPDKKAATTQVGNLTLRKMPKTEHAALYTQFVAGHALVTLRETFAVAPGLSAARVIVLRSDGADAYGKPRLACIMAGRWTRAAFDGVRWQEADAAVILQDTSTERAGREHTPDRASADQSDSGTADRSRAGEH